MEQKKRRPANRAGSGNGSSTRNVRSMNNSREVSRRTKGKNRYTREDDRSAQTRYYDDDDYYNPSEKRRKTSAGKTRRPERDDMKR